MKKFYVVLALIIFTFYRNSVVAKEHKNTHFNPTYESLTPSPDISPTLSPTPQPSSITPSPTTPEPSVSPEISPTGEPISQTPTPTIPVSTPTPTSVIIAQNNTEPPKNTDSHENSKLTSQSTSANMPQSQLKSGENFVIRLKKVAKVSLKPLTLNPLNQAKASLTASYKDGKLSQHVFNIMMFISGLFIFTGLFLLQIVKLKYAINSIRDSRLSKISFGRRYNL